VVGHLTDQHQVDTLLLDRRGPGTTHHDRNFSRPSQPSRGSIQLQAQRDDADAPAATPVHCHSRQIAQAGAQVQQSERLPPRDTPQDSPEPVSDGCGAAEPTVGPRDVPQRNRHSGWISRRVVQ